MNSAKLLTARELVAELDRLGVGTWTAAAVRRWIQEEAPCPVARRGEPGQTHRYNLVDVLAWLRARAERNGGAVLLAEKNGATVSPAGGEGEAPADISTLSPSELVAHAQQCGGGGELIDRLVEVIKDRDPRNWKATEEAMTIRMKRLEMEGSLVRVSELQRCLQVQQSSFQVATEQLRAQLRLAAASATGADLLAAIDHEIDATLERIAASVASDQQAAA